ncbi:3-hydroxyacyl-CoA dehydrogenase NAD-binding domain-containing protein [Microvirga zambiensis]|uniref:3-hydroxyacyl-CoA dehydrogenase NAD-binding domain-containing protein n=1 Tax=Microvirga zambiensis TaxID=1402137 RepID=UPI00191FB772|nr:3-hydroxyacyl-CoA dehydrogenase NAD-binding domain-containing protein [Microvirga zambiensis]
MNNNVVAVIGCGLIGQSWSALFACYGYDVKAWDPAPNWVPEFQAAVDKAREQVRALHGGSNAEGTITAASSLEEAVGCAFWIQENAPESVPLKIDLYSRIEAAAKPETVIASSTSSLTWSELSTHFSHRDRFVTAHPFNPPHLMPLVELYAPDASTRLRAEGFYNGLERKAVVLSQDAVGHIANRLASALWREAVNIVDQGIADVSAVDTALVHGPGLRWSVVGAHMAYHLGGGAGGIEHYLKHLGPSQERRWSTLGNPKLTPELCRRIVDGVMEEAAGQSVSELEASRDAGLMRALAARAGGRS